MILGIGNDIVDIGEMRRQLAHDDGGLKRDIFTPLEISYCESKRYPERHYSARFAAKEALFKALGTGKINAMSWLDIEIGRDAMGKPDMELLGATGEAAMRLGVGKTLVSLSHTDKWASATVILESTNGDKSNLR